MVYAGVNPTEPISIIFPSRGLSKDDWLPSSPCARVSFL